MRTVHHRASGWSFWIAPTLDRGWGYDPYVQRLIGRIRAGRHTHDLFDTNRLFLDSVGDRDLHLAECKARKPTKEQLEEYRILHKTQVWSEEQRKSVSKLSLITKDSYERNRAARAVFKAERERAQAEWLRQKREIDASLKRREQEWAEAEAAEKAKRKYLAWQKREAERVERLRRNKLEWLDPEPVPPPPPAPPWPVFKFHSMLGQTRSEGGRVSVVIGLLDVDDHHALVNSGRPHPVWIAKRDILDVEVIDSEVRMGGLILHRLTVKPEILAELSG